ncbi:MULTISPECIES: hypothetical protein [unclassified Microbacterium]|uniref:hypothetical protein n=1 Tax=unclassified Microbacterium TaxID=2609290 RepID=UPI0038654E2E
MTRNDTRPIEVGDRFETRDSRDAGRIVEVIEVLGLDQCGRDRIAKVNAGPDVVCGRTKQERTEYHRLRNTHYRIRTEVHPRNPEAVGRRVKVQESTLRDKYNRVSR